MKSYQISFVSSVLLFLALQVVLYQYFYINRLEQEVRLAQKAKDIDSDNIRDILYELNQAKTENQFLGSKQFVAGVVEAIAKPERYSEIWHSGYDRGASVQQYADQVGARIYTEKTEDK